MSTPAHLARFLPPTTTPAGTTSLPPGSSPSGADAEADSLRELSDFQVTARAVERSMHLENEGDYYACVVFPSNAHRAAFFAALGVPVDDEGMVDGVALARRLAVALPPIPPAKRFRAGTSWTQLPAIERPGDSRPGTIPEGGDA